MRQARRAVAAAVAVGGLVAAAGCGVVDTGVHVSGEAPSPAGPPVPRSGAGAVTESVDAVAVLRGDPGVDDTVKDAVARPCSEGYAAGWYPVYVRYHTIPDTEIPVALINVHTCADEVACAGGIAGYVYRLTEDGAERIYTADEPPTQVAWADGRLVVERATWSAGEAPQCPRTLDQRPLDWDGTRLTEGG